MKIEISHQDVTAIFRKHLINIEWLSENITPENYAKIIASIKKVKGAIYYYRPTTKLRVNVKDAIYNRLETCISVAEGHLEHTSLDKVFIKNCIIHDFKSAYTHFISA
jgi:hypothetical protein